MTRHIEATLWILCAALGVAFFALSGFYGWASIDLWTVLVLPLALRNRSRAALIGRRWPTGGAMILWAAAILTCSVAGLAPVVWPAASTWAGWLFGTLAWLGAILSIVIVVRVTFDGAVERLRAA